MKKVFLFLITLLILPSVFSAISLPERCQMQMGIYCKDHHILSGENSSIFLYIENGRGTDVVFTGFNATSTDFEDIVTCSWVGNRTIKNGFSETFYLRGCIIPPNFKDDKSWNLAGAWHSKEVGPEFTHISRGELRILRDASKDKPAYWDDLPIYAFFLALLLIIGIFFYKPNKKWLKVISYFVEGASVVYFFLCIMFLIIIVNVVLSLVILALSIIISIISLIKVKHKYSRVIFISILIANGLLWVIAYYGFLH